MGFFFFSNVLFCSTIESTDDQPGCAAVMRTTFEASFIHLQEILTKVLTTEITEDDLLLYEEWDASCQSVLRSPNQLKVFSSWIIIRRLHNQIASLNCFMKLCNQRWDIRRDRWHTIKWMLWIISLWEFVRRLISKQILVHTTHRVFKVIFFI